MEGRRERVKRRCEEGWEEKDKIGIMEETRESGKGRDEVEGEGGK